MNRNFRKIFSGIVVSDKMQKTITVVVDIYKKDPLYGKRVKQSKNSMFTMKNKLPKLVI